MYVGEAAAGEHVLGKKALQLFNDDVTNCHGVLDVVSLSPELIDGLYALTVSASMYSELYAAWVDAKALLKFLSDRKLSPRRDDLRCSRHRCDHPRRGRACRRLHE
jgi:hypothetical protein